MTSPIDLRRWERIRAEFGAAIELPVEEREARLSRLRSEDPAVATQVLELLKADSLAAGILEAPIADYTDSLLTPEEAEDERWEDAAPEDWAGRNIGRYRALNEIGHGGMGTVLLAERSDGEFEQRVAIKLLRRGMDSEEIVTRFRRERQILAQLEHPHIARLFDGGLTEGGQPYFAMEYVEGEPIVAYCERLALGVEARLRLLLDVCAAVQHAHRHLVIHRDLKPANILVTAEGEVKLLDFGIASLLAIEEDGEEPLRGEIASGALRVLTPEYAAPEQLLGRPETTATDVYALGLLLFELLAGRRPERGGSDSAATGVQLPSSTAPPERRRRLRGDLDRIAITALALDPERRYPSAEAFAADLRRHLDGQPVAARGKALPYRAAKFVRRHRVAVAALGATGLALVLGAGVALWQARQAAIEARKVAAVKDFLVGVFALADPENARGATITARELLDRGAARLERELAGDPAVLAELDATVAATYFGLGLYEPARRHTERALELRRISLGETHAATLSTRASLARILIETGKAEEGEKLLRSALATETARRDEGLRAGLLNELASARRTLGDFGEAERLRRELLALHERRHGPHSAEVGDALNALAVVLQNAGKYAEAEALQRRALDLRLRLFGREHTSVATDLYNLAFLLRLRERHAEARQLCAQAIDLRRKLLGPEHPHLALALHLQGMLLQQLGDYEGAAGHFREALAVQRNAHGELSQEVANVANSLAILAYLQGDLESAAGAFREALRAFESLYGRDHPDVAAVQLNLGGSLRDLGDFAAAESLLREGLATRLRLLGPEHPAVATAQNYLGTLLRRTGRYDESESVHRRALAIRLAQFEPRTEPVVRNRHALARVLHARGDLAGAEPLYEAALVDARALYPDGHDVVAEIQTSLGLLRLDQGRPAEAVALLAEAWSFVQREHGAADWRNGETPIVYGLALSASGSRSQATPLLSAGIDAIASCRMADDPLLRRAREALASGPTRSAS